MISRIVFALTDPGPCTQDEKNTGHIIGAVFWTAALLTIYLAYRHINKHWPKERNKKIILLASTIFLSALILAGLVIFFAVLNIGSGTGWCS
jgi:uncharacterized membrane protein YidH (DUF202 family)